MVLRCFWMPPSSLFVFFNLDDVFIVAKSVIKNYAIYILPLVCSLHFSPSLQSEVRNLYFTLTVSDIKCCSMAAECYLPGINQQNGDTAF